MARVILAEGEAIEGKVQQLISQELKDTQTGEMKRYPALEILNSTTHSIDTIILFHSILKESLFLAVEKGMLKIGSDISITNLGKRQGKNNNSYVLYDVIVNGEKVEAGRQELNMEDFTNLLS